MGYDTVYSLKLKSLNKKVRINDKAKEAIIERLTGSDFEGSEYSKDAWYALDAYGDCSDALHWYNAVDEIAVFSKLYPEILFTLHGEGDNNGDLWNVYIVNGLIQDAPAKPIYPKFDPLKLKEPK